MNLPLGKIKQAVVEVVISGSLIVVYNVMVISECNISTFFR